MHLLQNRTGSTDFSTRTEQNRNIGTFDQVDIIKENIIRANSVSLISILQHYSVSVNDQITKIQCPFSFHKGGQERTNSFYYYPNNSFYCFGCKTGGGPVDFVVAYENITKYNASIYILDNFIVGNEIKSSTLHYQDFFKFQLEFAHAVRNFILKNKEDTEALKFIDNICYAFDLMQQKYSLDIDGLRKVVNKLISKIELYK